MRVAIIRQKYTPFGGAEQYMSRLIDGLSSKGHEVHVLAAEWDSCISHGVMLHKIPIIRKPGWLKNLTFSLNCRRHLLNGKYDIVFSLERTLKQDIYRAGDGCHRQWLKQKNLGKGLLNKLATYLSPVQLAYLFLEKHLFNDKNLKAVISNSRRGKQEIVDLYKVDPEKIKVIYNGIDYQKITEPEHNKSSLFVEGNSLADKSLKVLYVGSGFKRKGVLTLLKTATLLGAEFHFFILGKDKISRYKSIADKLNVSDKVTFTGPIKDVIKYYKGCDVFVFPTLYDPFSNATLEAMAAGLPVITSIFNGASEIIENGVNGYVIDDPLDFNKISNILKFLLNEEIRLKVGKSAAATAREFSMERNVDETIKIFEEVLLVKQQQQLLKF